jgi:hypothetical protein
MTRTDKIAEIAANAGAQVAPPLVPNELVAFTVNGDGTLTCELADGSKHTIEASHQVPDDVGRLGLLCAGQMLVLLLPDLVRCGAPVPIDRRFHRRSRIVGGRRVVEFVEAGR